ncbi:MAG TPA: hypothetical protein VLB44_20710 [Kofleriaceae bacterium]|nr:hypothetical protein [Kofleriaceae bacterium]
MRIHGVIALVVAAVGCGSPKSVEPPRHEADASASVAELRAGRFPEAERAAAAVLIKDPRNAVAHAVHALARYDQAGERLIAEIGAVLDQGEGLRFFDHERGRAAWQQFLDELEAIDMDLEVAAADPSFSLELCLACWDNHDWNHNGRVDERDKKMLDLEFDGKGGELPAADPRRKPTYRFDVGDIHWARAMLAFQRAGVELVLAYRWSELDKLFLGKNPGTLTIKLIDGGRVRRARELVIAGLGFSEQERQAYLAETDDDREWVPSPRQKSYAMPLEVDQQLYATWSAVIGDVHRLLASQEGISMREVAALFDGDRAAALAPNAFLDLGAMLREPTDIVLDLGALDDKESAQNYERVLRGLLGHGYAPSMRASPLVGRLRHMREQLERGEDTIERKLRYLIWIN